MSSVRDELAKALRDALRLRTIPPHPITGQGGIGLNEHDLADVALDYLASSGGDLTDLLQRAASEWRKRAERAEYTLELLAVDFESRPAEEWGVPLDAGDTIEEQRGFTNGARAAITYAANRVREELRT